MSDSDTIRRIEEWMQEERAEGFTGCCESALEHGLTYELFSALVTENERRAQMLRELWSEVDCRIEHGAESCGHLEYVRGRLRAALDETPNTVTT